MSKKTPLVVDANGNPLAVDVNGAININGVIDLTESDSIESVSYNKSDGMYEINTVTGPIITLSKENAMALIEMLTYNLNGLERASHKAKLKEKIIKD